MLYLCRLINICFECFQKRKNFAFSYPFFRVYAFALHGCMIAVYFGLNARVNFYSPHFPLTRNVKKRMRELRELIESFISTKWLLSDFHQASCFSHSVRLHSIAWAYAFFAASSSSFEQNICTISIYENANAFVAKMLRVMSVCVSLVCADLCAFKS